MRVSFVNNVSSLMGGTLNFTRDAIQALPDCEHQIVSFGKWGPDAQAAFPGVQLDFALGKDAAAVAIRDFKPDLLVLNNTGADRIPNAIGQAVPVYMLHSLHRTWSSATARCHKTFCVSQWLQERSGLKTDAILYQPVGTPPERPGGPRMHARLAGRIATPRKAKWDQEEYWPHLQAAVKADPRLKVEFVGHQQRPEEVDWLLPGHIGHEHRNRLSSWDYMIYTSRLEESYGRTVCEAQRAGCVPVVSRRGGFVEQIQHGVDGFLVDSPEDVAEAIREMADDQRLAQLKAAARESGNKRGSLKTWRKEFLSRIAG